MARFNLDEYETVEERIKRFYSMASDGRIVTECVIPGTDGKWLFKAYVYLTAGDQANGLPKATGYASESDGGPQTDWKAELGETSAIGRALANMDLSGNKRASREEMQKVAAAEVDYVAELEKAKTKAEVLDLYNKAKRTQAPKSVLDLITEKGKTLK
jgi:hypothetical protein